MLLRTTTIPVLPRLSSSVATRMSSSPLKFPKFVPVEETAKPDGFKFTLVSYNILAQAYVKSTSFPHSPSSCLKWKARSQAVLSVLKNLGADFLCLQELDEYESFYKGNIESSGYSSTYIQRSGQKRDGCGIFYKHDLAELILQDIIDYNDLANSIEEGEVQDNRQQNNTTIATKDPEPKTGSISESTQDRGDPNDPRFRLKRDCVGLMAAFKLKDLPQNVVIVANTHIYWDPEWADVKLAQVKYLLSRLAQFKELVSDRFECTPSLIVAGDFNSTPGDKVYQYLTSGNSSAAMPAGCDDLPIPLCSVYASTRGEPPFTNCTPGFTGTLDYIFFSPTENIKPISFLELPEPNSSDIDGGLPNFSHPSDHLPIGAVFVIPQE